MFKYVVEHRDAARCASSPESIEREKVDGMLGVKDVMKCIQIITTPNRNAKPGVGMGKAPAKSVFP
jgi:hypothetical protein